MNKKKGFSEELGGDTLDPRESENRAERERRKVNGSKRVIWESYVAAGNMFFGERKYHNALIDYRAALMYGTPEDKEAQKDLDNKIKKIEDEIRLENFHSSPSTHNKYPLAVLGIASLLAALGFVSLSLTGNVIAGLEGNNSRFIGLCFFVCGLIFSFIYLKKK
jgi:hypothetical protein